MKIESVSGTLNWIMVVMFAMLIFAGPALSALNAGFFGLVIFGILLAVALKFILPRLKIKKEKALFWCIILSVLCFATKFAWVYLVRIEPMVDYKTYFDYAKTLSENFLAPNRYVAMFPHIFGYSWFLSFFIKLFGDGELLVPVINVLFSVIAGVLIFRISYKLMGVCEAVFSYVLWILCPSQTIYNSLVISDLFYTVMALAFILLVTEFDMSDKVKKTGFWGLAAGLILRLVNIARPIAAILIIALFIWLIVLKTSEWTSVNFRKKWIPFVIMLVLCYFVTGTAWDRYVEKRIGEEPASLPGYNIMVGFNMDSFGAWNAEDSKLLMEDYSVREGTTAVWAQEQIMEDAKKRILSGNINFIKLFIGKIKIFLGSDASAVNYHADVLGNKTEPLSNLCNVFYYMTVMLSILSVIALGRHHKKTTMAIILLFVLGVILAQMLVEVAGRYHYSIIPALILVSQTGIFYKSKE